MGSIATLDLVITIIVLLSAGIGLVRGLVKEVLSLAAWIAAFAAAIYFSPQVADMLPPAWGAQSIRTAIAFGFLFVGALIGAAILQWVVGQLISSTGLSGTDRFFGFLFGSARGLLVCVVLLIGLREIAGDALWWQSSILTDELLAFEDDVRSLLGQARDLVRDTPVLDISLPAVPAADV